MSKENYDVFFNPGVEAPAASKSTEEYNPSADKGKGGVYQAIIRFVPWWKDPKHGSIQDKWVCYLVDPVTQRGRYIDCPSSVGKPSPLQDTYFKLKKSESVQMQKLAQSFSRRRSYASLVQIIRDENAPELEGKIMVFRYGIKIWEKINAELKPIIPGTENDPFEVLTGKAFALVITKVSGFNNYDQSKFVDKKIPIVIPNKEGKLIMITPKSDKQEVYEWVKAQSPDLSKYAYKEWDQDTYDYVNHVIVAVTGEGQVASKYAGIVNKDSKVSSAPANSANISSQEISVENFDLEEGTGLENLPDFNFNSPSKLSGIEGDLDDIIKNM